MARVLVLGFLGRKELLFSGNRARRGGRARRRTEGLVPLEVGSGMRCLSRGAVCSLRLSEASVTQLRSRGAHFLTRPVLST